MGVCNPLIANHICIIITKCKLFNVKCNHYETQNRFFNLFRRLRACR